MEQIVRHEETTCDIYMFQEVRMCDTSGHPVVESTDGVKQQPSAMRFFTVPRWNDLGSGFEQTQLGGGFKYFLFSPLLGEMIKFD